MKIATCNIYIHRKNAKNKDLSKSERNIGLIISTLAVRQSLPTGFFLAWLHDLTFFFAGLLFWRIFLIWWLIWVVFYCHDYICRCFFLDMVTYLTVFCHVYICRCFFLTWSPFWQLLWRRQRLFLIYYFFWWHSYVFLSFLEVYFFIKVTFLDFLTLLIFLVVTRDYHLWELFFVNFSEAFIFLS